MGSPLHLNFDDMQAKTAALVGFSKLCLVH